MVLYVYDERWRISRRSGYDFGGNAYETQVFDEKAAARGSLNASRSGPSTENQLPDDQAVDLWAKDPQRENTGRPPSNSAERGGPASISHEGEDCA